jgi:hypothetical protein
MLKRLYEEGKCGLVTFPKLLLKDIDYVFIPSEYQLTGTHDCGEIDNSEKEEHFEWYRQNKNCGRARGDLKGYFSSYWLSDLAKYSATTSNCYVNPSGQVDFPCDKNIGIKGLAIHFVMHKKGEF